MICGTSDTPSQDERVYGNEAQNLLGKVGHTHGPHRMHAYIHMLYDTFSLLPVSSDLSLFRLTAAFEYSARLLSVFRPLTS